MIGLTAADYLADPYYQGALAFANRMRDRVDEPPLDFLPPASGCRCPLEQAIPHTVAVRHDHVWIATTYGRLRVDLPPGVRRFVADFDAGRYPDLLPLPGVECPASSHRPKCAQSAIKRVLSGMGV